MVGTGALVREANGWREGDTLVPIVPMTVADSVRQRFDALGEPARSVLVAGAVLGRRFDPGLLPAMAGLEAPVVHAALRLGVEAQLLDEDGSGTGRFRFRHALSRKALLDQLLAVERTALARRALQALEDRAAAGTDGSAEAAVPAELAADLAERAGEHGRAARLLIGSARRALDAGRLATALAGAVPRELAAGFPRTRAELAEAVALVPEHSDIGRSQLWGLYVLAHLGDERPEPPPPARVSRINVGCLALADAVALGARRDRDAAQAAFARGDALLAPAPWYRQLARRLVAEHALADGWGTPAEWLREAVAFFAASGNDALATACRSLMRKAGVPAVRKGRGEHAVPVELAALGATSRELDVLALVADGLSNRDIAARLYLSPRTVEKHVERLLAKTASTSRAQLAALAARASR